MTVEQLQARLRALHAGIGHEGCLSLTLDQEPDGTCYVSHWSRPGGRYQPERWHAIGVGPLGDCLAAAERYADAHHRRQRRRDDARRAAVTAKGYAPAEEAEAELIAAE